MTITLGNLVLVAGQTRNSSGNPVGPDGLSIRDERGVERRELVGADGIEPEWIRCDARFVAFGVTRVFATPALALAYVAGAGLSEGRQAAAALKFDDATVMARACVTRRECTHEGCAVAVRYEIEGY